MKEIKNDVIKNFYNSVAGKYSDLFCNELDARPLERKLLDMFLERINNDEIILDIGTGPGEIAGYLGKKRKNVVGIDLSDEMISYAKSNYPGVEFLVQDLMSLNFKNSSIMGITAFYAIVHFDYEQIQMAFKEFYRVLKKGAEGLISVWNSSDIRFKDVNYHGDIYMSWRKDGKEHMRYYYLYEKDELKKLLKKCGFNTEKIYYDSKKMNIIAEISKP